MIRLSSLAGLALLAVSPATAQDHPGELPVDPYEVSNANAGAEPLSNTATLEAFGGVPGIERVVDRLIENIRADERIEGIFRASDWVRLHRTLSEQFCYLLNGPCDYTGRDMQSVHADHGITTAEFNALVENLQLAMDAEGVPFRAQNRLLARLAPMHRDVVTR